MKIKWKLFKMSFPCICNECGALATTKREYCEICGAQNSHKDVTKEHYAKYLTTTE